MTGLEKPSTRVWGRRAARWARWTAFGLLAVAGCAAPNPTTQPAQRVSDHTVAKADRAATSDTPLPDDRSEAPDGPGRIHIVQPGETLYSITAKYYGDGRQFRRIWVANRNRLADPKDLRVGMKLIIP